MIQDLEKVLRKQQQEHPFQKYLFEPKGTTSDHWTRYMLPKLCKEAEVKTFGFHAIRHLSASILDEAGIPIQTIQLNS
jgi:integrase